MASKYTIPASATTIREIAVAEGLHENYVRKLVNGPGFPEPVRVIQRMKFFDYRQVNAFFRKREKSKGGMKRKRPALERGPRLQAG